MEKIIKHFTPTPYTIAGKGQFIEFVYDLSFYDDNEDSVYDNYIRNTRNHFLKESGIEKLI